MKPLIRLSDSEDHLSVSNENNIQEFVNRNRAPEIVFQAGHISWVHIWNRKIYEYIKKTYLELGRNWWFKPSNSQTSLEEFYFFKPISRSNRKPDHCYYVLCSMILTVLQIRRYKNNDFFFTRQSSGKCKQFLTYRRRIGL